MSGDQGRQHREKKVELVIKLIELLVQIRNLIFKNFDPIENRRLFLLVHVNITEKCIAFQWIFAVGESKLESGESEETTSFNGIVTIGVLGEEAGLRRERRVARPARCRAKVRSLYSIISEAKN